MKPDLYTKVILTVIAVFLGILAMRPMLNPPVAQAQVPKPFLQFDQKVSRVYAPDGSFMAFGRVAVDLNTGNVYGFPTDAEGYPRNPAKSAPVVSDPVLLGRYNLERISATPLEK